MLSAFQEAQRDYASHGIVVAQEGFLQSAMAPAYEEILRRGLLTLDVEAYAAPEEYDALQERFAGAEATYTIEALMHDGQALQSGTSHNFSSGLRMMP